MYKSASSVPPPTPLNTTFLISTLTSVLFFSHRFSLHSMKGIDLHIQYIHEARSRIRKNYNTQLLPDLWEERGGCVSVCATHTHISSGALGHAGWRITKCLWQEEVRAVTCSILDPSSGFFSPHSHAAFAILFTARHRSGKCQLCGGIRITETFWCRGYKTCTRDILRFYVRWNKDISGFVFKLDLLCLFSHLVTVHCMHWKWHCTACSCHQ